MKIMKLGLVSSHGTNMLWSFFHSICEGAHINNQQSHFGTSVVTLQIGNTSIIETVGVLLTNYVPPRVPFFIG